MQSASSSRTRTIGQYLNAQGFFCSLDFLHAFLQICRVLAVVVLDRHPLTLSVAFRDMSSTQCLLVRHSIRGHLTSRNQDRP